MSSILPKGKLGIARINPKISLFYGPPKVGKTKKLAELDNCLVLDTEKGAEPFEMMRVPISSISGGTGWKDETRTELAFTSADAVYNDILQQGMEALKSLPPGVKPKPPYKRIAIDTIDRFEDFCEAEATRKFLNTPIGKGMLEKGTITGKSVLEMPQGGGYFYLRNEFMDQINRFSSICEHLILIAHIREKNIMKGDVLVSTSDISLTGKLAPIVCGAADVIGFVYHDAKEGTMVSFENYAGGVMGARFPRLAGKRMPFDWSKIYLPEGTPVSEA